MPDSNPEATFKYVAQQLDDPGLDLLSYGYVSVLNMTLSGQAAVAAVSSVITFPVMAAVIRFKRDMHSVLLMLFVWLIPMGYFS